MVIPMKQVMALVVALALANMTHAQTQDVTVLCYHDVRDDVGTAPVITGHNTIAASPAIMPGGSHLDADQYAISTRNLASHFDWLRSHGYHVVSLQQLVDARTDGAPLPSHAVILTFDDGLRSAYTKVFPLLKAFHYPAVLAVVGAWTDLKEHEQIDYGYRMFDRGDFATWDELREMQNSGLVEIASHSYNLHRGVAANPQGNLIPAISAHQYDVQTHQYETDEEYAARIRADLARNSAEIEEKIGRAPRVIVWPYGVYTQASESIAASLGMSISFTLGLPVTFPGKPFGRTGLRAIPRLMSMSNPGAGEFAWNLRHVYLGSTVRAIQVDLDYVYDPDPAQQERNLSALLDRVKRLNVNQVWLEAYADPDGSGAPRSVYFPNRHLPMRSDLFSRAAWQLRTRSGVQVYAWMPVLAWRVPSAESQSRLEIHPQPGVPPESPVRLNPFLPETRAFVGDMYEDLGRAAPIAGILFGDDAILRDTDQLGAEAPPPGPARTKALIAFTNNLADKVRRWSPELVTTRNLFSEPAIQPDAETWFAQSLPSFLASYDLVALMAMPDMENAQHPDRWLKGLAKDVASVPSGLQRTVFELQTVDWRTKTSIGAWQLRHQMRLLQESGALHLAYYPDDFARNKPNAAKLFPAISASTYPALEP